MPVPSSPTGLATLPFAERLMLWTMRAWVMGLNRSKPMAPQILAAFTKAGAPEAADDLHRFMLGFAQGAARQIAVDCICKQQISEDERRLLDILSCHQQDRALDALTLLRSMMHPRHAVAVSWDAGRLADRIKAAGYVLHPRGPAVHMPMNGGGDAPVRLPRTLH